MQPQPDERKLDEIDTDRSTSPLRQPRTLFDLSRDRRASSVWPQAVRPAPPSVHAATCARPQGQRRIHGAALPHLTGRFIAPLTSAPGGSKPASNRSRSRGSFGTRPAEPKRKRALRGLRPLRSQIARSRSLPWSAQSSRRRPCPPAASTVASAPGAERTAFRAGKLRAGGACRPTDRRGVSSERWQSMARARGTLWITRVAAA